MDTEFMFQGQRAIADPIVDGQLAQDPLVTSLVLGQPQFTPLPGESLLPTIMVDNWVYKYTVYNNEHLQDHDTKRPMRAPIKHGDWKASTLPGKLDRYSFRILKDQDELTNAHPSLSIRQKSAELARRIVVMDVERDIRDLLSTTANYTTATAIAGASEWNAAGGDSRSNIRASALAISALTGLQPGDLTVYLPLSSLEAAKDDTTMLAIRTNYETAIVDEQILANYWGVKRVWSANPVEELAGTVVPMYNDIAIVYYDGGAANMDTTYGSLTWAVNFSWNKGVASAAYYDNTHTSWSFPWNEYAQPKIINADCAAILTNCAA